MSGPVGKWIVLICLTLVNVRLSAGRKVAAMDDICARGAYAFCANRARQQSPPSAASGPSRDLPQPAQSSSKSGPPRTPFSATPPPLPTVGEYCTKYLEHYNYFCAGANAKDAKAGDFCPTYLSYCDVSSSVPAAGGAGSAQSTTPVPELPPAKIQQICTDYQPIANLYCFRPEIPKGWSVKKNCDVYLKYCVAGAGNQSQGQNTSKPLTQVLQENIKPCAKFQNDYIGFCVQNPKPFNERVAEFCRNYKAVCVPMQVPTADSLAAAADLPQTQSQAQLQPQSQIQQLQPRPMGINNPVGAIGGNPWSMAGSPVSPLGSPTPLGNPNAITDPIGSLGGNPSSVTNPLGALSGSPASSMMSPAGMGNPGSSMIRGMQGGQQVPVDSQGNVLSGMAANPLAVGSQTAVGNMAGVSQGTAVNPFGQVATGRSVLAGPVGVQSGSAVDFSGIPGLSQLGSIPGLGKRRRKRDLSTMWLLSLNARRVF